MADDPNDRDEPFEDEGDEDEGVVGGEDDIATGDEAPEPGSEERPGGSEPGSEPPESGPGGAGEPATDREGTVEDEPTTERSGDVTGGTGATEAGTSEDEPTTETGIGGEATAGTEAGSAEEGMAETDGPERGATDAEPMSEGATEEEPVTDTGTTGAETGTGGGEIGEPGTTESGSTEEERTSESDTRSTVTGPDDQTDTTTDVGRSETGRGERGTGASPGSATDLPENAEGKTVVSADGETVGIVTEVEGQTLYVDPDPGLTERITAKLGWGDRDQDDRPIQVDQIREVDDRGRLVLTETSP